ncbi:protein RTM1 [Aspergillus udagawae]|uniref:Protein RTM1 n=1 Tax=Aspergillus udagawae TaxID=91492 RepID=A0ABQ1AHX7_9EURO|nr:protein RTM1 [Aspergillus udagawae]GFF82237.1 protein RTM1 [Aspergillus udagawae]GFG05782.1 protein RTM1 [Aspergillus udagawae]
MSSDDKVVSYYKYDPSHVLPAVFAGVVCLSLVAHIWQNFRYRFWRVTFWAFWGGLLFTVGWILRCFSSYHPGNINLYIAQAVFIYLAPPVYSAAAYNIVGRLMNYLPMHAVFHPDRVLIVFVYAGAAVEGITVAGAAKYAAAGDDTAQYKSGGVLIAVGLILQAVVECLVIAVVAMIHTRAAKAGTVPRNVKTLCMTLYGTSTFVLLRCIFRAVESFEMFGNIGCTENCGPILSNEWYLFAFELGPMLIFTFWLNLLHPGRFLPRNKTRYLDTDGYTERIGPGWSDRRDPWETFIDPLVFQGKIKGQASHDQYWLRPDEWSTCKDGSFAEGTATNVKSTQTSREKVLRPGEV